MQQYLKLYGDLQATFQKISVIRISRSQNSHVNSLATLASSLDECVPRMIYVELLEQPSIERHAIVASTTIPGPSGIDPYIMFLSNGSQPNNPKESKKVRRMSACFWRFKDNKLYLRSFGGPYLLCLHLDNVTKLLAKLHDGICGGNSRGRSLAHQAMTQGFQWLSMQRDAVDFVKKCDRCQRHAPIIHQPGGNLNPIASPWPFTQWDLDIIGPFP